MGNFFPLCHIFWSIQSRPHIGQYKLDPPQWWEILCTNMGRGERLWGTWSWGYWRVYHSSDWYCVAAHRGSSWGAIIHQVGRMGRLWGVWWWWFNYRVGWHCRIRFCSRILWGGACVQWPWWKYGGGTSMWLMVQNFHSYPSICLHVCLGWIFDSWICVVSCWSIVWQRGRPSRILT